MKRIYVVTSVATQEQKLVRASNRAAARSIAAKNDYAVELASQDDLVKLVGAGKSVIEEPDGPEEQSAGTDSV